MAKIWESIWDRRFVVLDVFVFLCIGGLLVTCCFYDPMAVRLDKLIQKHGVAIYLSYAALFGSLLGFVLASMTMLAGYANNPRLNLIRKAGHLQTLWSIYTFTLYILLIGLAVSLFVLLSGVHSKWAFLPLTWFVLFAFVRLLRCIWAVSSITSLVLKDTNAKGQPRPSDHINLWLSEELAAMDIAYQQPQCIIHKEEYEGVEVPYEEKWTLTIGKDGHEFADVKWTNLIDQQPIRFRFYDREVDGVQGFKYFNGDIGTIAQWIAEMTKSIKHKTPSQ